MKLLILTQYYPPEVGAPQNRLHELAVQLQKNQVHVDVLTAMPNYPKMELYPAYKKGDIKEEVIDGIQVFRSKIFVSKSKGIIARLLNYFSFVWTSYWRGRKLGNYDYLMVESPPLFLGYSAMRLSKKLNAKLIFNVSDLWPESAEKMGVVNNRLLLKMAYRLEARCYRSANIVTGQTMGIVDNINSRFPETYTYWLPNGVDVNFYNPEKITATGFRNKNNIPESNVVFFYGGILGYAQGLQVILQAADRIRDVSSITIIIQGAGPEKDKLHDLKNQLGLPNVMFLPPEPKEQMPGILKEVDVALVPLRKLEIFEGAIPSKIFEALAMEKPLLLGVDGEARQHFIEQAHAGLFYEPENIDELVSCMLKLASERKENEEMGRRGRQYVIDNFNRTSIAGKFIEILLKNNEGVISEMHEVFTKEIKKLAIVIPCRNEAKYIAECIHAIYDCGRPDKVLIDVYIVDGKSDDGTQELVRNLALQYKGLHLVDNVKQLTPFAFNLGIQAGGKVDFVQIVGARHILSKNYLEKCLEILFENKDVWCVGGKIVNHYVNETSEIISKAMSTSFGMGLGNFRTLSKSGYTDTVTSPMYPHWVFEKVGFFDEELARNQDDDFNFRVIQAGGKIYYENEISLKYYVRESYKGLWRQFFQYGYWKVYVNKKHKAVTTIRQLVPPLFVVYILTIPFTYFLGTWLFLIWSIPLLVYFFTAALYTVRLANGLKQMNELAKTFFTLHLSYGLGYLMGIVDFLLMNKKPSDKQKKLSR